jgi:hypothetical protein
LNMTMRIRMPSTLPKTLSVIPTPRHDSVVESSCRRFVLHQTAYCAV